MYKNNLIISGENSSSQISSIVDSFDAKKILLVCGKSFDKIGVKKHFENLSLPTIRFSGFKPNPVYEDVCLGVDLYLDEGCDLIVAVGGGSAIDVAKCIKLFAKMDKNSVYLEQEYFDSKIPFIAIPTTAGTGSESTKHAVIYYNGEKQSISHESLIPDVAILDSEPLKLLPIYHKKSAMLDALCQGIESWWSIKSTKTSRVYSAQAVFLIANNWEDYLAGQEDTALDMLKASNFAGKAINISETTAPHAMSYELTNLFGFAHGHAASLCLPVVWQYMNENLNNLQESKEKEYLNEIFQNIAKTLGHSNVKKSIDWFFWLLKELDLEKPRSRSESDLKKLVESVNLTRLKNNPIPLDENSLRNLYSNILQIDK